MKSHPERSIRMKKDKSTKKFEKDQKKGHEKEIASKDLKKTSGGNRRESTIDYLY